MFAPPPNLAQRLARIAATVRAFVFLEDPPARPELGDTASATRARAGWRAPSAKLEPSAALEPYAALESYAALDHRGAASSRALRPAYAPDADQRHPHRRPVRQARHPRRPGATPARPAVCVTPVAPRQSARSGAGIAVRACERQ